jgi:hypothetical protein
MPIFDEEEKPPRNFEYIFLIVPLVIGFVWRSVQFANPAKAMGAIAVEGALLAFAYLLLKRLAPDSWLLWFFGATVMWLFVFFIAT